MKKTYYLYLAVIITLLVSARFMGPKGFVPSTINDFFLPGSQPLESGTFTNPDQCDNCHGGYDLNVEPAFNWRGSMMSQAQRDPLYLACLAIANQDAPESGDLCIRCHTPKGWLEGRSEPTDGSALTADDRESITCHFCHRMIPPGPAGVNMYPDDPLYIAQPGNDPSCYTLDQNSLSGLANIPESHGNGSYVVDDLDNRRGPFFDPQANHNTPYSPFHPDAALCGTCHDVSNPVHNTVRDGSGNILGYAPNGFDAPSPSFNTYDMFPIERTYSEWLMSEYNTPGGVSGTYFGGNKPAVSTCKDCHMRDVTGKGCDKSYAPVRDDLPLHDMTGGNTFIPGLIESVYPGETDPAAIAAGVLRARDMLQHAATVELTVDQVGQTANVKVTNETGHKLPSGYPEGRRIWINLQAFNSITGDSFESGFYDVNTGELDKTGAKIYEIKPGLSPGLASALGLTPGVSFHFVLNDTIYKDNRIPPRGFTNAGFEEIQSPVVDYTYNDGEYWDETLYAIPFIPDSVDVKLYYQTVSKEYIDFLRDENVTNDAGNLMYSLWDQNGKSTPELMNHETWANEIPLVLWTGNVSSDWDTPGNWSSGSVPGAAHYVTIPSVAPNWPVKSGDLVIGTHCNTLQMDGASEITVTGNLEIQTGHALAVEDATQRIQGNFIQNGSYTAGTGTLIMNGNVLAQIGGSSTVDFYNLTISKDLAEVLTLVNVNVLNDLTINERAWFTNGIGLELNVLGNMSMYNSASAKSSFIDWGITLVTGATNVYMHYTDGRWYNVSSPLNNTLSMIFMDMYLYLFNESSYIWDNIFATDYWLEPGFGYLIWSDIGNPLVDYYGGGFNTGEISPVLQFTDRNTNGLVDDDEGWNMLGNPYPCAIDITSPSMVWSDGVSGTIYLYNGSNYSTYNRNTGVGTLGGTQYVPSMQGFFVKVSATSPSPLVSFNEGARLHHDQLNYKTKVVENEIRIELQGSTILDEVVFLHHEGATEGFDESYDALRLKGLDDKPFMYTQVDSKQMVMNAVDSFTREMKFPLNVIGQYEEPLQLKIKSLHLPQEFDCYLEDCLNGEMILIEEGDLITLTDDAGRAERNYVLHFYASGMDINTIHQFLKVYSYGNLVSIEKNTEDQMAVKVFNINGQLIDLFDFVGASHQFTIDMDGVYLLQLMENGFIDNHWVVIQ